MNIRESSIHVHHAVDHLTHINCPLASAALGRRQQWADVRQGSYDLAIERGNALQRFRRDRRLRFAIEARVRGKSAADRLAVRQTESKPLVTELRIWFQAQLAKLPARGPTAEAIRHALNHWDGLCRFLDDGRIELDTRASSVP